ncbi:MAG: dihydrolipoyl dehydrogenase [Neisseriaceae bacterium]
MALVDLKVPDIGGSKDVNIAEIYVKVGDLINKDDNILMLETDKATMEVPAEFSGIVKEICVKIGTKVNEGDLILKLDNQQKQQEIKNNKPQQDESINKVSNVDDSCEVLVIGAGPGGYTAAFRAADLGKKVTLIEKHPTLGGVCLNVGCIPSKALLHVAKVINEAEEMKSHGVGFGEVKLDINKIRDYKSGVVKKLTLGLNGLAKQRKVNVIEGIAKFTSANTVKVETENGIKNIQFDSAIIAVGSHSVKLPNFPNDDNRIIDSTSALELDSIPKSMLIVGGGIIGLEMAEVYSTLGANITVVELGDSLIPSADRDLVKVLESRIKKKYKAIYTNTLCDKVEAKKDGIYVTFKGPNGFNETHKYDKVLVAVGRRPNGKNLDVEKAGVFIDERGFIPVDKQCRTNIPRIFAIGDVVGQPMLAHKATHEGRVAAENCASGKSYFDARTIPSVAYTDPEIAWMGITENEAKKNGLEIEVGKFPWAASGRALGNGRDDGFTKIITDKKNNKIIGAGIVGVNAGELLAEAVLAMEMDCDIHDVALTVHAHPTLSETIAFACEMVDGSITDLYVPKKK